MREQLEDAAQALSVWLSGTVDDALRWWDRPRPRRFCLWGGSASWTQIGSIEDKFYVRRAREDARRRQSFRQIVRAIAALNEQFTRITVAAGEAMRQLTAALAPIAATQERHARTFAAALAQRQLPPPGGTS